MINPMLFPKSMNPIVKIVLFVWLSSLFLLFPLPILHGREMRLLDVEAIAQDNAVSLTEFDRELLAKAVENFFGSYRYETKLQIHLSGEAELDGPPETFSLTIHSHLQMIIDTVPKFRARAILKNNLEESEEEYELISNGEQIWIHNPKTLQYAILTPDEFLDSQSYITLGMSSFLFVSFAEMIDFVLLSQNLPKDMENPLSIEQILQSAIADANFLLKRTVRQESDREYYIYELDDPNRATQMNIWIDPETARFYRPIVSLEDEKRGGLLLRENIIQRQEIPDSENIDFQFIPSARAEQVETIDIFDF